MSSKENGVIAGIEQAEADANLQYGISLLHPYLVTHSIQPHHEEEVRKQEERL